jgi:hypothetical protein
VQKGGNNRGSLIPTAGVTAAYSELEQVPLAQNNAECFFRYFRVVQ